MIAPPTSIRPSRCTVALNAWLAREEAVAAGTAVAIDPVLLGLPDRETLLRALCHRFSSTLERLLDAEPEVDTAPYAALLAAYRMAVAQRPADWRALRRERHDPVVAELTRQQEARIAHRAWVTPAAVAEVAGQVGQPDTTPFRGSPRGRRRRSAPRVLARRAG